ncbi:HAMP domain-containing protein [Bacillus sp. NP157]|nr:HAMP domain-containing protein [Bacillus sp. NP157]
MKYLSRFRIATRLAALGLLLLAATLIVGAEGWRGLDRMHAFQARSTQTSQAYAAAADTARVAQVDFKRQVQEWKDLLLRGSDPAALAKHRDGFVHMADTVRGDLVRLRGQVQALGLPVAEVDTAMATHAGLRTTYLAALEHYKASDVTSAHVVDGLVKGIDRPPTAAIDGIVEHVRAASAASARQIEEASAAVYRQVLMLLAGVVLGALVLGAIVTVLLARSITRPIGHAVAVAGAVADGDLSSVVEAEGRDETAQLLRALARMNTKLREVVASIRQGAEEISQSTGEIAEGNLDLSSRTSEQAAALEETASSMQEFTSGVHANAANAREARVAAEQSLAGAREGEQAMRDAVVAMERIANVSGRITEITEAIERIASQTHILALNAAVEAARAGDAGKGFNIVAGEVRVLASHSKTAAGQIRALLQESSETIDDGSRQVSRAGDRMAMLVGDVDRVTHAVRTIATLSDTQASGILQVNEAVRQIDEVTQSNSALVEEAAAAADAVKSRAAALVDSVAFFRTEAA